jgi:FtsP/CotA-like multicopper oxidase with cupredoxin domain
MKTIPFIFIAALALARAAVAADTPVITPNGVTLPFVMKDGVKEFHLTAEPIKWEMALGLVINAWGYNGRTPGPTIEAIEGDRVRILVTNHLPEPTTLHWHGLFVPNGMDGVSGLTQKPIQPGETYAYEFTLKQHGTYLYHPHADEMTQIALGMEGFFIIHPKEPENPRVDRDFAIFLHEWFVEPGSSTPNPNVMTDYNLFSFNSRVYPGTAPLVAKLGDRVRVRFANITQESHAIHIHGHRFWVTQTDGGDIPPSAQWPETTVLVPPGTTRTVEFIADNPGDWPLHCHMLHHPMNGMSHDIPNLIGVDQAAASRKVSQLIDGYMEMGSHGMDEMLGMHMTGPTNTLPMMAGQGQFGPIGMGGMFTLVKIRDGLTNYEDPGPYQNPPGTLAYPVAQENPATK